MTRCGCFKEGKPCTYLYMPLYELQQSKRSTYTDTKKAERIKRKHAFQIELPKSKKIAEERGEAITQSLWSDFETIVLDECCKSGDNADNTLVKSYNDYSQTTYCVVQLPPCVVFREKTRGQILSKRRCLKQ